MKLTEHMMEQNRDDLLKIAGEIGMQFPPNANTEELRRLVTETLLKPDIVASQLVTLTDSQIALFERACEEGMFLPERSELEDSFAVEDTHCAFPYEKTEEREPLNFMTLLKEGKKDPEEAVRKLTEAFQKMAEVYLSVPEEIAAVYREVSTPEFQRRRHISSWLTVCLDVCGILYAITPVPVLARVYTLKEPVEEEELRQALSLLPHTDDGWVYDKDGDKVICRPMEEREIQSVLDRQGDREFHLPKLEDMENLSTGYYPFTVPAYDNFRLFLKEYCGKNNWDADGAVSELWERLLREKSDLEGDLQWMVDQTGADMKVMPLIVRLYENCMKNTPCTLYRGCTRAEMALPIDALDFQEKRFDLGFDMDAPKIRIGRNEPCPCGSGRKYKKCCGR